MVQVAKNQLSKPKHFHQFSHHICDVLVGAVFGVDGLADALDGDEAARLVLHQPLQLRVPEPRHALPVEDALHHLTVNDKFTTQ